MKNYVYEMCFTDNKKRHLKLKVYSSQKNELAKTILAV